MLFLLGINNSWFHYCLQDRVPFCGEIGVTGVWMAKREVLVPVYWHNTGSPRAFLFVGAVLLVLFKWTRMEVLANEIQQRIHQQPLDSVRQRSSKEVSSQACRGGISWRMTGFQYSAWVSSLQMGLQTSDDRDGWYYVDTCSPNAGRRLAST